jgi:hypothetical protein
MTESIDSNANRLIHFQLALWNWFVLLALVVGGLFALLLTLVIYLPLLIFPVLEFLSPYRDLNVARMIALGDDARDVARVMEKRPACVFIDQFNGKGVLACAVESGKIPLVEFAIHLGADVNGGYLQAAEHGLESKIGDSPIQIAKDKDFALIADILANAARRR